MNRRGAKDAKMDAVGCLVLGVPRIDFMPYHTTEGTSLPALCGLAHRRSGFPLDTPTELGRRKDGNPHPSSQHE